MSKCLHFSLGTHARTKDGEVWVWQFRDEADDSDEEDQTQNKMIIIFATVGTCNI